MSVLYVKQVSITPMDYAFYLCNYMYTYAMPFLCTNTSLYIEHTVYLKAAFDAHFNFCVQGFKLLSQRVL